jgi:hypothetical protein
MAELLLDLECFMIKQKESVMEKRSDRAAMRLKMKARKLMVAGRVDEMVRVLYHVFNGSQVSGTDGISHA